MTDKHLSEPKTQINWPVWIELTSLFPRLFYFPNLYRLYNDHSMLYIDDYAQSQCLSWCKEIYTVPSFPQNSPICFGSLSRFTAMTGISQVNYVSSWSYCTYRLTALNRQQWHVAVTIIQLPSRYCGGAALQHSVHGGALLGASARHAGCVVWPHDR